MSAIHAGMTIEEVAALVCETLSSHGIKTVLSGGAGVSIYSDNEYESYDLDCVMVGLAKKTVFERNRGATGRIGERNTG